MQLGERVVHWIDVQWGRAQCKSMCKQRGWNYLRHYIPHLDFFRQAQTCSLQSWARLAARERHGGVKEWAVLGDHNVSTPHYLSPSPYLLISFSPYHRHGWFQFKSIWDQGVRHKRLPAELDEVVVLMKAICLVEAHSRLDSLRECYSLIRSTSSLICFQRHSRIIVVIENLTGTAMENYECQGVSNECDTLR